MRKKQGQEELLCDREIDRKTKKLIGKEERESERIKYNLLFKMKSQKKTNKHPN